MAYFAACIFLSAFLLFQVEPMIGKLILPWFGGTPAVWSTVMLFFQVLLTGGYAYAYWLIGRMRRRESIHLVLLGLSLVLLLVLGLIWKAPIIPNENMKPVGPVSPIWEIFKLLAISVGIPFFLLASNSPLIQDWFMRSYPGRSPYRLYALSNAGSLIALVTYPILVEPSLSLSWQGRIWSIGYLCFAILAAYGTIRILRGGSVARPALPASPPDAEADRRPSAKEIVLWISLSACASVMLLATTSHITQEVAVIPFLWVLPLTIYLGTFILAFSEERAYSRQLYLVLFFLATLFYGWALVHGANAGMPLLMELAVFSLVLFFGCMVCHGELYRLRPHPKYLTSFYLMVSLGGALGGILINFVAPYIFRGFWELPLGFFLCWILFAGVIWMTRTSRKPKWLFVLNDGLMWSALIISGVMAVQFIHADLVGSLGSWRNFYGVVRVQQSGTPGQPLYNHRLVHGVTVHGLQFQAPDRRSLGTTYYSPQSGVGLAILDHPRYGADMRVGVLGLGIGTLATYGQPGDVYRFYEINPVVIRLAEGQGGYFSYLKDSPARIEIIPGDARLSLEGELAQGHPQGYDVLVLDVFSSDSIPVHLLDEEAFSLYLQHLQGDGILAINISNRFLNLVPVVWTLADRFELARVLIENSGNAPGASPSAWMLLSRDPARLEVPAIQNAATPLGDYKTRVRLWTDEYSNLFQILNP